MRRLLTFRMKYHLAKGQVMEAEGDLNRAQIRDLVRRAQRKNNGRHKE